MKHTIPEQFIGKKVNASRSVTLETNQEAADFFNIVRNRLLDIDNWYRTAKLPFSTFELVNSSDQTEVSAVKIGDYIKINIPGPGPANGEHVDFVRVENIEETSDKSIYILTMTLRPSVEPTATTNSDVQHFFNAMSTSTLQIVHDGKTITANYFGRNEVPNSDVDSFSDKIRNSIVGWAAKLGLSFSQWDALVSGIVDDKIVKDSQETN